jgi:hypothetical protein
VDKGPGRKKSKKEERRKKKEGSPDRMTQRLSAPAQPRAASRELRAVPSREPLAVRRKP